MLHHIACEGYGQIVAQPFLANFGRKRVAIPLVGLFGRNATEEVARVEDFEQQLVSFVAVLAQQRGEVFHRRGFERLESAGAEYAFYRVENVSAFDHLFGTEVACSFGNGWFLCHVSVGLC